MRRDRDDWRRNNIWVGKGVPSWFVVPIIILLAWVAHLALR